MILRVGSEIASFRRMSRSRVLEYLEPMECLSFVFGVVCVCESVYVWGVCARYFFFVETCAVCSVCRSLCVLLRLCSVLFAMQRSCLYLFCIYILALYMQYFDDVCGKSCGHTCVSTCMSLVALPVCRVCADICREACGTFNNILGAKGRIHE